MEQSNNISWLRRLFRRRATPTNNEVHRRTESAGGSTSVAAAGGSWSDLSRLAVRSPLVAGQLTVRRFPVWRPLPDVVDDIRPVRHRLTGVDHISAVNRRLGGDRKASSPIVKLTSGRIVSNEMVTKSRTETESNRRRSSDEPVFTSATRHHRSVDGDGVCKTKSRDQTHLPEHSNGLSLSLVSTMADMCNSSTSPVTSMDSGFEQFTRLPSVVEDRSLTTRLAGKVWDVNRHCGTTNLFKRPSKTHVGYRRRSACNLSAKSVSSSDDDGNYVDRSGSRTRIVRRRTRSERDLRRRRSASASCGSEDLSMARAQSHGGGARYQPSCRESVEEEDLYEQLRRQFSFSEAVLSSPLPSRRRSITSFADRRRSHPAAAATSTVAATRDVLMSGGVYLTSKDIDACSTSAVVGLDGGISGRGESGDGEGRGGGGGYVNSSVMFLSLEPRRRLCDGVATRAESTSLLVEGWHRLRRTDRHRSGSPAAERQPKRTAAGRCRPTVCHVMTHRPSSKNGK